MKPNYHTPDDDIKGVRRLVASIIEQAVDDLKGNIVCKQTNALQFFRGNGFKYWCLVIGYSKREINRARKRILKDF